MRTRMGMACALSGLAIALVPTAASARPAASAASKSVITLSGSTSVAPLAVKLIKTYLRKNSGKVGFKLAQGGSDIGVADVAAGRVSIGDSSRDAKPSDPGGLVFHKIARDAICLATNPANKVGNLSQGQVQDIFSGKIRDWGQVPGATVGGPIDLVVRTPASGTQDAFQKLFLSSAKVFSSAAAKASNGLVAASVKTDKQAVGYLSYAFTSGLNDTAYQGVACNLRTAKAGQYPGSRNFWMVTRGAVSRRSAVGKFIGWVQNNAQAQKIISTEWVPLR